MKHDSFDKANLFFLFLFSVQVAVSLTNTPIFPQKKKRYINKLVFGLFKDDQPKKILTIIL
jgi:hypothetical protein